MVDQRTDEHIRRRAGGPAPQILVKRVYDPPEADDGARVLVDRLWPRGVSKQRAELDLWAKEAAPSHELRTQWHSDPEAHSPERFTAFADAYRAELARGSARDALDGLAALARDRGRVTLLYGARDERTNHALVLREALLDRLAADREA